MAIASLKWQWQAEVQVEPQLLPLLVLLAIPRLSLSSSAFVFLPMSVKGSSDRRSLVRYALSVFFFL